MSIKIEELEIYLEITEENSLKFAKHFKSIIDNLEKLDFPKSKSKKINKEDLIKDTIKSQTSNLTDKEENDLFNLINTRNLILPFCNYDFNLRIDIEPKYHMIASNIASDFCEIDEIMVVLKYLLPKFDLNDEIKIKYVSTGDTLNCYGAIMNSHKFKEINLDDWLENN